MKIYDSDTETRECLAICIALTVLLGGAALFFSAYAAKLKATINQLNSEVYLLREACPDANTPPLHRLEPPGKVPSIVDKQA